MSQLSFSSFDAALMVRDSQGHYLPATADQILDAARQAIEQKMQRGASFTSPVAVKEYLRAKLAGFEHEVFAVLFLDTQHRLTTRTTSSITGTSINTPTTVASAAPDWKPNRLMAAATASSKKLLAPINAEGQAMLCFSPTRRLSQ